MTGAHRAARQRRTFAHRVMVVATAFVASIVLTYVTSYVIYQPAPVGDAANALSPDPTSSGGDGMDAASVSGFSVFPFRSYSRAPHSSATTSAASPTASNTSISESTPAAVPTSTAATTGSTPSQSTAQPTPTTSSPATPPPAGVPSGTTLTRYTGPTTITTDGTVINGADVSSPLVIKAANVTITNSKIHGTGSLGVYVVSGSLNIAQSTITGFQNGLLGDNVNAFGVEFTALLDDGFIIGSNSTYDQMWCHDMTPESGAHADCGQLEAGQVNAVVKNSWLDGGPVGSGMNSGLFIAPDLGPSTDGPVTIDNNVLGGGNYTLYCVDGNNGQYYIKNISITNNRFLRDFQYGPMNVNVPATMSNNTWLDNGKPV